jgi:hypothetical protein
VADNRRSSTRHAVTLAGKIAIFGNTYDCTIVNLSLGGAQIAASAKQPMGTRCNVAFKIPTLENEIEVGATVRWSDDKSVGIQFDGLRARDVWGLNEYFKSLSSD